MSEIPVRIPESKPPHPTFTTVRSGPQELAVLMTKSNDVLLLLVTGDPTEPHRGPPVSGRSVNIGTPEPQ